MKTIRTMTVSLMALVVLGSSFPVMGQEEVAGGRMPDSDVSVRPSSVQPPAITTTPTTSVRGSLFKQAAMAPVPLGSDGNPIGVAPVSFIAVQAPRPKKFQKNDVLTIVVQEDSNYVSTAQSQSEKQQDFDMAIQSWLQLHTTKNGVPSATGVGNSGTLPEAKFKYDNNRQNQASQQRQDSFSVRISATVVDVKPNGTVVIEAVKQIAVDKEVQVYRLSGICRAEDVTPDNTVLSTQLANLSLSKQSKGEVRDGVKRGWLNGIIDTVSPF